MRGIRIGARFCGPRLNRGIPAVGLALLLAGCTLTRPNCGEECVSRKVDERMGYSLGPPAPCGGLVLPPEFGQQPLTEELAVLIALWNNPAFREQLVELQLTHADLVQAGLLPNPEFYYNSPAHLKEFRYLFDFPLEALWLRPVRVKIAKFENARACERLTQLALDLIRDTRQAFADVLLGQARREVAARAVDHRERVAKFAEDRFAAGDASRQEVATARIEADLARQQAIRTGYERPLAEERLRNLLGLAGCRPPLTLDPTPAPRVAGLDACALAEEAVRTRPDVLAAEEAAAAAEERVCFAKVGWVRFLGIADATSGVTDHVFSPGFRVTVPLFNWNQGLIARAEADLERAIRLRASVQNQVRLDVHQSLLRYQQAVVELNYLLEKVRPDVQAAIRRAETAYKEGDVNYLIVLETIRQLIDTYDREAMLEADLRRAWADLERGVGRHLAPAPSGTAP
jgi:cobalt-zinc-cadmium efflux system outer membrane protein